MKNSAYLLYLAVVALVSIVGIASFCAAQSSPPHITANGGQDGLNVITYHDVIWSDSRGDEILDVQGVEHFIDEAPTPTPSPTPTPTPTPTGTTRSSGVLAMDSPGIIYAGVSIETMRWPHYVRPATPAEIHADLWTSDGKHWRASWVEVHP